MRASRQFRERRNGLRGAVDPGFERFPILGGNGDDASMKHLGLGGVDGLAPHEIAERRTRLFRRRLENGAFLGITRMLMMEVFWVCCDMRMTLAYAA